MVHLNPTLVLHLSCLMWELARAGINRSWGGGGEGWVLYFFLGGGGGGTFVSRWLLACEPNTYKSTTIAHSGPLDR